VKAAFVFEIKDGPDPAGKKYWGRFGLLTNEKFGLETKPKYEALQLLNKMAGNRIKISGEGTWVKGFASKEGSKIYLISVNYDQREVHREKVSVAFENLNNGRYLYQENFLRKKGRSLIKTVSLGSLTEKVLLFPNDLVLIEINRASD